MKTEGPGASRCRPHILGGLAYLPHEIDQRTKAIYCQSLAQSANLHRGNYTTISAIDLEFLFALYDSYFMDGVLKKLCSDRLGFRVSTRMTKSAGTLIYRRRNGPYTICISEVLMLGAFTSERESVVVNGLPCRDRLEATMRVLEHEIIHLLELLAFGSTSCARPRFRELSRRVFGHTDVTHELGSGAIAPGSPHSVTQGDTVRFKYRGRSYSGTVTRVTKRATVMVRDRFGNYVDKAGARHSKYYVPLHRLE